MEEMRYYDAAIAYKSIIGISTQISKKKYLEEEIGEI
jgi:hypothetical protein